MSAAGREELKIDVKALEGSGDIFHRYHAQVIQGLLGPIRPYYGDPDERDDALIDRAEQVSEIMINGPDEIYIDGGNGLERLEGASFGPEDRLIALARAILQFAGKRLDPNDLSIEARTPEKYRVHIVQAPAARPGLSISIRKFPKNRLTLKNLVDKKSFPAQAREYFEAVMARKLNILVSGGTGSGKTTLLNAFSELIAENDRILIIEDTSEIRFEEKRHVLQLEAQKPGRDGAGGITIRELLRASLRMRPDRVIVGECRDGEALDMIQAMNTGHDGSMSTIHANNSEDCLLRLETLCLMAGLQFPLLALQRQIASAVQVIVQIQRRHGERRRVTEITEVHGFDLDKQFYRIERIFSLAPDAEDETGYSLQWTGISPLLGQRDPDNAKALIANWKAARTTP